MKKTAIIITVLAISLAAACKKDKDPVPCTCPNPLSSGSGMYHFPLTIGSYWVYQTIYMDTAYNITSTADIDSVYISNDTMINGKQYFVKKSVTLSGSSGLSLIYLGPTRDSAGYIVNPNGSFIKHDDFTNILAASSTLIPPYSSISRMASKDSTVTVPAGTFTTIDYLQHISILDPPPFTGNRNRYNHTIMANNIGTVFISSCFYYTPAMVGVRLLRYHIAS